MNVVIAKEALKFTMIIKIKFQINEKSMIKT